jgi:hypothetical protein
MPRRAVCRKCRRAGSLDDYRTARTGLALTAFRADGSAPGIVAGLPASFTAASDYSFWTGRLLTIGFLAGSSRYVNSTPASILPTTPASPARLRSAPSKISRRPAIAPPPIRRLAPAWVAGDRIAASGRCAAAQAAGSAKRGRDRKRVRASSPPGSATRPRPRFTELLYETGSYWSKAPDLMNAAPVSIALSGPSILPCAWVVP